MQFHDITLMSETLKSRIHIRGISMCSDKCYRRWFLWHLTISYPVRWRAYMRNWYIFAGFRQNSSCYVHCISTPLWTRWWVLKTHIPRKNQARSVPRSTHLGKNTQINLKKQNSGSKQVVITSTVGKEITTRQGSQGCNWIRNLATPNWLKKIFWRAEESCRRIHTRGSGLLLNRQSWVPFEHVSLRFQVLCWTW
jgi:hypothetical protein